MSGMDDSCTLIPLKFKYQDDCFICGICNMSVHKSKARDLQNHIWSELHPNKTCSHMTQNSSKMQNTCSLISKIMVGLFDFARKHEANLPKNVLSCANKGVQTTETAPSISNLDTSSPSKSQTCLAVPIRAEPIRTDRDIESSISHTQRNISIECSGTVERVKIVRQSLEKHGNTHMVLSLGKQTPSGETLIYCSGETVQHSFGESLETSCGESLETSCGESLETSCGESMETSSGEPVPPFSREILQKSSGEPIAVNGFTLNSQDAMKVKEMLVELEQEKIAQWNTERRCAICLYSSDIKLMLQWHLQNHLKCSENGFTGYKCPHCSHTSKKEGLVRDHIEKHHKQGLVEDKLRGRKRIEHKENESPSLTAMRQEAEVGENQDSSENHMLDFDGTFENEDFSQESAEMFDADAGKKCEHRRRIRLRLAKVGEQWVSAKASPSSWESPVDSSHEVSAMLDDTDYDARHSNTEEQFDTLPKQVMPVWLADIPQASGSHRSKDILNTSAESSPQPTTPEIYLQSMATLNTDNFQESQSPDYCNCSDHEKQAVELAGKSDKQSQAVECEIISETSRSEGPSRDLLNKCHQEIPDGAKGEQVVAEVHIISEEASQNEVAPEDDDSNGSGICLPEPSLVSSELQMITLPSEPSVPSRMHLPAEKQPNDSNEEMKNNSESGMTELPREPSEETMQYSGIKTPDKSKEEMEKGIELCMVKLPRKPSVLYRIHLPDEKQPNDPNEEMQTGIEPGRTELPRESSVKTLQHSGTKLTNNPKEGKQTDYKRLIQLLMKPMVPFMMDLPDENQPHDSNEETQNFSTSDVAVRHADKDDQTGSEFPQPEVTAAPDSGEERETMSEHLTTNEHIGNVPDVINTQITLSCDTEKGQLKIIQRSHDLDDSGNEVQKTEQPTLGKSSRKDAKTRPEEHKVINCPLEADEAVAIDEQMREANMSEQSKTDHANSREPHTITQYILGSVHIKKVWETLMELKEDAQGRWEFEKKCAICFYCSDSKNALQKHLESHLFPLENGFKCPLCLYTSKVLMPVRQHLKKCHPHDSGQDGATCRSRPGEEREDASKNGVIPNVESHEMDNTCGSEAPEHVIKEDANVNPARDEQFNVQNSGESNPTPRITGEMRIFCERLGLTEVMRSDRHVVSDETALEVKDETVANILPHQDTASRDSQETCSITCTAERHLQEEECGSSQQLITLQDHEFNSAVVEVAENHSISREPIEVTNFRLEDHTISQLQNFLKNLNANASGRWCEERKCPVCVYVSRRKASLEKHIQSHLQPLPKGYKCPQCLYTAKGERYINNHLDKYHLHHSAQDNLRGKKQIGAEDQGTGNTSQIAVTEENEGDRNLDSNEHDTPGSIGQDRAEGSTYNESSLQIPPYKASGEIPKENADPQQTLDINDDTETADSLHCLRSSDPDNSKKGDAESMGGVVGNASQDNKLTKDHEPIPVSEYLIDGNQAIQVQEMLERLHKEARGKWEYKKRCPICIFATDIKMNLQKHLNSHLHSLTKGFRCPLCLYASMSERRVRLHLMNYHQHAQSAEIQQNHARTKSGNSKKDPIPGTRRESMKRKDERSSPAIFKHHDGKCPPRQPINMPETSTDSIYGYSCSECSYKSLFKVDTSKHFRRNHPGLPVPIAYPIFSLELGVAESDINATEKIFIGIKPASSMSDVEQRRQRSSGLMENMEPYPRPSTSSSMHGEKEAGEKSKSQVSNIEHIDLTRSPSSSEEDPIETREDRTSWLKRIRQDQMETNASKESSIHEDTHATDGTYRIIQEKPERKEAEVHAEPCNGQQSSKLKLILKRIHSNKLSQPKGCVCMQQTTTALKSGYACPECKWRSGDKAKVIRHFIETHPGVELPVALPIYRLADDNEGNSNGDCEDTERSLGGSQAKQQPICEYHQTSVRDISMPRKIMSKGRRDLQSKRKPTSRCSTGKTFLTEVTRGKANNDSKTDGDSDSYNDNHRAGPITTRKRQRSSQRKRTLTNEPEPQKKRSRLASSTTRAQPANRLKAKKPLLQRVSSRKGSNSTKKQKAGLVKRQTLSAASRGKSHAHQRTPIGQLKHLAGKSYLKCRLCPLTIPSVGGKSRMMEHLRRHLQYKPYSCRYCKFKGAAGYEIRRHIRLVHPKKKVGVKCNRDIDIEASLRDHFDVVERGVKPKKV